MRKEKSSDLMIASLITDSPVAFRISEPKCTVRVSGQEKLVVRKAEEPCWPQASHPSPGPLRAGTGRQDGTGQDRTGRDGTGRDGMGWDGTGALPERGGRDRSHAAQASFPAGEEFCRDTMDKAKEGERWVEAVLGQTTGTLDLQKVSPNPHFIY
jgi:hypothetical protein